MLYHSLEEKKAAGLMKSITDRLNFGGLIEIEASRDENKKTGDASDVTLATVQLGLDAEINERLTGHILLLWEEDSTDPINVDEGTLTYKALGNVTLVGGKTYIPFGVFKTHFVSDPQTLTLGETNETVAMVNYVEGPVDVSLGMFNGSADDGGGNEVQDYFGNVTVSPIDAVTFGAYYTSNIGDSDYMTTLLTVPVSETVPAFGGFLSAAWGPYSLDAEYIKTKREFRTADLDANLDGKGDQPMAYNIELLWQMDPAIEIAVKYEGNDNLFDLPETQYGAVLSYGLFENVTARLEVLQGKYQDDKKRLLFTGQISVEF
jgi:hypothetical protein